MTTIQSSINIRVIIPQESLGVDVQCSGLIMDLISFLEKKLFTMQGT